MALRNRQWRLARHPQGLLTSDDLEYREVDLVEAPLRPGEIRIRNLAFLCAPTMRNWMEPKGTGLYPSSPLGAPVMAPAAAEVIASEDPRYPVGARVSLISSWQDFDTIDASARPVQRLPDDLEVTDAIGKFGLNSVTAYFGLLRVGEPRSGETLLVSGAAGSTGAVAAQIGRIKGCRVIGVAGGADKCRWLTDELGLDAAIDYRQAGMAERLRELAPEGVDIFFDNVGGEILEAAVQSMRKFGRIVLCGQISGYNAAESIQRVGLDMMRLIYGSVRMQGFLMSDYRDQLPEAVQDLRAWDRQGLLKLRTDVRIGFENLPNSFNDLFHGKNDGTLIVRVMPDEAA